MMGTGPEFLLELAHLDTKVYFFGLLIGIEV